MRKHEIGESGGKERGEKNDARPEQESQDGNQVQKVSCHNCGKVGQIARECHEREDKQRDVKAEITCFKCNEKGHISRFCGKKERDSKMIHMGNMRIIEVEKKENPNYKEVKINEKKLWAYIDQGSDCTTIRKSDVEALGVEINPRTTTLRGFAGQCQTMGQTEVWESWNKQLNSVIMRSDCTTIRKSDVEALGVEINPRTTTLRGFAGQCQTVGQTEVWVTIDEVRRQTTVHVVPNEAQDIPVIVGLDILGQEDIRVVRQGKTMQIEDVRKDANEKTI
uniref:CCHC-type domain-containing protein n=1 Tax=Lutzomyia longipalpis TaxID=7200 RepID=A0A1B0C8Q2_LUTLO